MQQRDDDHQSMCHVAKRFTYFLRHTILDKKCFKSFLDRCTVDNLLQYTLEREEITDRAIRSTLLFIIRDN